MGRHKRKKLPRRMVPVRLYVDTYIKLRAKAAKDHITIQRFFEALVQEYLYDKPLFMKVIKKYTEPAAYESGGNLSDLEAEQLLRRLEDYSPLRDEQPAPITDVLDEQIGLKP